MKNNGSGTVEMVPGTGFNQSKQVRYFCTLPLCGKLWVSALVETKVVKLSIMVSFDYQHDRANKCLT